MFHSVKRIRLVVGLLGAMALIPLLASGQSSNHLDPSFVGPPVCDGSTAQKLKCVKLALSKGDVESFTCGPVNVVPPTTDIINWQNGFSYCGSAIAYNIFYRCVPAPATLDAKFTVCRSVSQKIECSRIQACKMAPNQFGINVCVPVGAPIPNWASETGYTTAQCLPVIVAPQPIDNAQQPQQE
jgi:hypothetical protein